MQFLQGEDPQLVKRKGNKFHNANFWHNFLSDSRPEVGMGATPFLWTQRVAYFYCRSVNNWFSLDVFFSKIVVVFFVVIDSLMALAPHRWLVRGFFFRTRNINYDKWFGLTRGNLPELYLGFQHIIYVALKEGISFPHLSFRTVPYTRVYGHEGQTY